MTDDFDDLPETHLDDEDYEAFLARELDAEGNVRGDPPVTRFLVMIIVLLALLILILFW